MLNRRLLSLGGISDRLEIQQLLVDYSAAIDRRRFDDLDRIFTWDADIGIRQPKGTRSRPQRYSRESVCVRA